MLFVSTLAALLATFELRWKNKQAGNFRQAGNSDIRLKLRVNENSKHQEGRGVRNDEITVMVKNSTSRVAAARSDSMKLNVLLLPGDGIGVEVTREARQGTQSYRRRVPA